MRGLTKLRNEIYILCESSVFVFEVRTPFRLRRKIEIEEIKYPYDIGSSEKENCLYVSDHGENCIWKITREGDDHYNIIKWLTTDYDPLPLSVSSNGQLLVVTETSSILRIYGSDAELLHSIQLPRDIIEPVHAVETSTGNVIILHEWMKEKEEEIGSSGRK